MPPERIRELLEAEPFIPFTVHLTDRHSVHIGERDAASLEDSGRVLVVQTLVHKEMYLETLSTAAITRLVARVAEPEVALPSPEEKVALPPEQIVPPRKTRVLFICTRNSARSQMAEAWFNRLGGERMEAESAGFDPGELHPLAVEAMLEVGIDISKKAPKSIFALYRSGAIFAFTICVCDEGAEKTPIFPGMTERLHWSFPDPTSGEDGSDAAVLERMRSVRDALRERIEAWISTLPAVGPVYQPSIAREDALVRGPVGS